jgi:glutamate-1-semialdehyde 2,1-aminomutase
MTDIDGNVYLDCFLCNGPLLLGHRYPAVVEALRQHEPMGSLLVNPPLAIELAEEIQRYVPCAQRIRFLNSGTEAVLSAVRLARAFTGKQKVVKFLGHYHGQDDQFLVGLEPSGAAIGSGVSADAIAGSIQVRYGDLGALTEALDRNSDIAAVILDPAMHAGGLWGSSTEYLRAVREITSMRRIVLIFDEVITGFRLSIGGAQAVHGVVPDLATFAKALGAGEKLAAVVGREEVMQALDPDRPPSRAAVFQSGTGNDGTSALAAGLAAVRSYRELDLAGGYRLLFARTENLARGIADAFHRRGIPCHINRLGPMMQLFLSDAEPGFEAFSRIPPAPLALFYLAMINEGVLLSLPSSNHIYFSFVHSDDDMTQILEKVATVLDRYDFRALIQAAESHF